MHFMNRQRQRHMSGETEHDRGREDAAAATDGAESHGSEKPSIHIHSHSAGHTVHIMHPDGQHESHEHELGDAEGITAHVHSHIGRDGEQRPGEEHEDEAGDHFGRMGVEP
jgi:hypothetical protein